MRTIIVSGVLQSDFIDEIDKVISLDGGDRIFGASQNFSIEIYDDEDGKVYHGAKALSLVLERRKEQLKGEQNESF